MFRLKLHIIGVFVLMFAVLSSCGSVSDSGPDSPWLNREADLLAHNLQKITLEEGIAGTVLIREGDCMPRPFPGADCFLFPARKMVEIFEKTHLSQLSGRTGPLRSKINAERIASVRSDNEGFFEYALPPGTYSVFIVTPDGRYVVSGSDGQGFVNTVTIEADAIEMLRHIWNRAAF